MSAIKNENIAFENSREALAVFPPPKTSAGEIIKALNLNVHKAVLLIIGGADNLQDELKPKLTQLFGRGIARAAANVNAAIIDGGTRAGVMEMMGQGVADRGFKSALIGVAPLGQVTYPGSTGPGTTQLDSNHSNFVLVQGDTWGSETNTIFQLVRELRNTLPAVALLAGGGKTARSEVLQAVRQNLPLIVIEGSGEFADEVAAAWKARPNLPDDPVMAEIIADGRIELHPLANSVEAAQRLVVRKLSGDNVLVQAWERFAVYDLNAILQQDRFNRLQIAIITLGVLATALAVTKEFATRGAEVPPWTRWWYVRYVLVVIPIVLTILITAANKFKQGNKWLLLRAGAEAIKREIYRFRARAGDYKEPFNGITPIAPGAIPLPTPEQVLAQRIEDITRRAMSTEVNSSSLRPYDKEKDFPPYVKYCGDDGYSMLTPDRYVQVRLEDQLGYYKRSALKHEKKLKFFQWVIYIIGGLGTLLAAINQQVWIALTTALATALTTYLSYQQTERTLTKYNQSFTDLDNVKSWWTALPAEDQTKQENLDTLVKHTEDVLQSELDGWVQQMQNALAELRKDQVKAPETNDTSGTVADTAPVKKSAADAANRVSDQAVASDKADGTEEQPEVDTP
ncbi:MAG TPA: DUF4231 domain-containing protein [Pyrinomonadaceae bacterium]|nr:DUF4231 domain-containing protein [Pyrinomonadaceae bacterium]